MNKRYYPLAILLLVAGCGIPTDNNTAFEIDSDRVDADLFEPTTTTNLGPALDDEKTGRLYLVDENDNLVAINRRFKDAPTPQDVLDALTQPILATEINSFGFLKTELPPSLNPILSETDTKSGEIVIKVNDEANLRNTAQTDTDRTKRIFAQIVCTLDWFQILENTKVGEITGVIIEDSQGRIIAIDDETVSINRPARPEDFGNCIPIAKPDLETP